MERRALPPCGSCRRLSSAAAHIQLCGRLEEVWRWSQSSTVGKPCTVFLCMPAEMHQPRHSSHTKAEMGAPCFLWLQIHQLWQRLRWQVCLSSGVCSHLSIFTFPAAQKVLFIPEGPLNSVQNALSVTSAWGAQAFGSVFSANLPITSRGLELMVSRQHNGCPVIQTRSSALNVHDFKSPELHFFKCVSLFFLPYTLKRKTGLKTLTSAVY